MTEETAAAALTEAVPTCDRCGCSELAPCIMESRGACHWVATYICSACVEPSDTQDLRDAATTFQFPMSVFEAVTIRDVLVAAAAGDVTPEGSSRRIAQDTADALDVFLARVDEIQAEQRARAAGANMSGDEGGG